jgi:hypothetical protein
LQDSVEKNIIKTFKTFYENPAIFLTEADVQCYLYSLLINDPFLKKFFASFNYLTTKKEISNTILIHSELAVSMSSSKRKRYDISIWKPRKNIDFSEWETLVGIEIKYNRRLPARSEASGIIKDIRSVRYNKQGYVLWLNWDREIDDNHLKVAQKLANKYENVKLFFLDLYSEPIKTNIDEILEMNTIEEKE